MINIIRYVMSYFQYYWLCHNIIFLLKLSSFTHAFTPFNKLILTFSKPFNIQDSNYNLQIQPKVLLNQRIVSIESRNNVLKMMPIGVPKVAYHIPGSHTAEWIDIYNRLYRERIIFLSQEIDHELANQIIGVLLYLDCEDNSKPIHLYINSPGGSIVSGLAIYDTMQHIKSDVITINIGLAASMGSLLLASGSKGKRYALPHSRTMIHQPIGGAQGQAEDIRIEANHILKTRENIVNIYCRKTGLPKEKIINDLDRDKFMSAIEAKEEGLIDHIISLEKNKFFPN